MTATRAVVFSGPTLSPDTVARHLNARRLPPVAQGDVYRASLERPWAIGIIDGYFELVPAVWHKEILWAMSRGIHVFGAASMGALRACELERYGMVGVGEVFEAFRDGRLEDDDEVAVRHAPSDSGFTAQSEALVNMRATLDEAVRQSIIGSTVRDALVVIAKETFYAARTYQSVIEKAREKDVAFDALDALARWLPEGRVDQKAADAVAMLVHMQAIAATDPAPLQPQFRFEHTEMWEQVGRGGRNHGGREGTSLSALDSAVHEELRLEGSARVADVRARAAERAMGLEQAERQGLAPTEDGITSAAVTLRRRLGLYRQDAFRRWLEKEALSDESFLELAEDEAKLAAVRDLFAPEIRGRVLDVLRLESSYGRLHARARRKEKALSESGFAAPEVGNDESVQALLDWWFAGQLGEPVPEDLEAYAAALGCGDTLELIRILARERAFQEIGGG